MKIFKKSLSLLVCLSLICSSLFVSAQTFENNSRRQLRKGVYPSTPTLEKAQFPNSQNLLKNGSFNEPANQSIVGNSASKYWTYWLNTKGPFSSELLPSSLNRNSKMIKVQTKGKGNGLVQVFGKFDTGPEVVDACVWILVEKGKVGVGVGNGGNTHISMVLENTGRWERITVSNAVSPANEIIIYTANNQDAVFYVESASVKVRSEIMDYSCCMPE